MIPERYLLLQDITYELGLSTLAEWSLAQNKFILSYPHYIRHLQHEHSNDQAKVRLHCMNHGWLQPKWEILCISYT